MDPKAQFFFYLASFICFLLAAIGDAWRYGARTRRGVTSALALIPLGLALFVFPTLWTVAKLAW
jgi:hypothetical protein